ncbi:hypothetical protein CLF_105727 [Clonorchis sinensis]|uniref:Uncharacterized protein n=1 Tax=Clonorchis sinensis TaxID=79923 RepID=G7YE30_CLOSI|nr:hypothetical protein CLF_105727 [Clonorchis sinensis]
MCLPKITQCRLRAKHTASSRPKVSKVDEWPHHKKKNKRPLLLKRDGNIVSVTEGQKNKPSEEIHEAVNSDSKRSILLCLGQKAAKTHRSVSRRQTCEVQHSGKPDPTSPIHLIPRLDPEDDGSQAMRLHRTAHENTFSAPSCCDVIPHQLTCPHNYVRLIPHSPVQNREFLTVSTAYTDNTSDFATPASYIQGEEVDDFQLSASLPSHKQNLYNTSASFIDSGWGSMSPMTSDLCTMGYPAAIRTQPIKRREHRAEREHAVAQDSFLGRFSKSEGSIMFSSEKYEQKGMKSLTEGYEQGISQRCDSKSKRSAYGAVHAVAKQNPSPKDYGKSPSAADIREMSGPANLYPNSRSGDLIVEEVWRKSAADRSIAQQQECSISVPVLKERDIRLPLPPLFVTSKVDNKSSTKDRTPVSETKSRFLETFFSANVPEDETYGELCETGLNEKFASVRPKPPDMSKRSVRRIKRDSIHSRLSDELQEASEASSAPSFRSDYVVTRNQDSVATARYADLMYIDQNLGEQGYPVQNAIELYGPSPVMKSRSMNAIRLEEQEYNASRMLEIPTSEKQCNAGTEAENMRLPISPTCKAKTSRRSYPLVHQVDELMAKLDGPMGKPGEKVLSSARSWMINSTDGAESIGRNNYYTASFDPHVLKRGLSQVPHNMESNTDGNKCTDDQNRLYNWRFSPVRSENFGDGPELTKESSSPTAISSEATTNASCFSALSTEQFVEKLIEDDMTFFDQTTLVMHSTLVEDTSEFCLTMQETSADVCIQASASTSDFYVQEMNNTTESGLCSHFSVDLDSEEQQPQVTTDQVIQSTTFAEGLKDNVDSRGDRRKCTTQEGIVSSKLVPANSAGSQDVDRDGDRRDEVDSGIDFSYSSCGAHQSDSESAEIASGISNSQYQVSIPRNVESICQPDNQSPVSKADADVILTDHSPLLGAMLRTHRDTPGEPMRLDGNDISCLKPVLSENPAHFVSEVSWDGSRVSDLETTRNDATEDSGFSSLLVGGSNVSGEEQTNTTPRAYRTEQCEVHFNETRVELGVPSFLHTSPSAVQQKQSSPSHDQIILVSESSNSALCHDASSLNIPPEKSSISEWQKNRLEGWQLRSATTDYGIDYGVSVGSEFQSAGTHFQNSPSSPETESTQRTNPEVRKETDKFDLDNHRGIPSTSSLDEKDDRDNTQTNLVASMAHQTMKRDVNDYAQPEMPQSSNQLEMSKSLVSALATPCGYTAHLSQYVSDSLLECEPTGEYFGVSAFAHTIPTATLRYIAHGLEVANQIAPHITEAVSPEYQGQVESITLRQNRNEAREEQRIEQETSDLAVSDERCNLSDDNTFDEKVRMSGQIAHNHELSNNDCLHRQLFFLDMQPQDSKYHAIKPDFSGAHLEPSSSCVSCANEAYQTASEVTNSKGVLSPGDLRMLPTVQTMDQSSRGELEDGKCKTPKISKSTHIAEGACASSVDEHANRELSSELHRQMSGIENETGNYSRDAQPLDQIVRGQRQWWSTQFPQHEENESETQSAYVLNENSPDRSEPPDTSMDQTIGGLFAFLGPSRVHSSFDEGLFHTVDHVSFRPCDPRQTTLGINQQHSFFTEAAGFHILPIVESGASSESEHHSTQAETLVPQNTESWFTGVIQDTTLKGGQQPPALSLLAARQVGELQERTYVTDDRSTPVTAAEHETQWQGDRIVTLVQQNMVIPSNPTASTPRNSSLGSDNAIPYGIQSSVNSPCLDRPSEITVFLTEPEIIPTYITPKFSTPPADLKQAIEAIQCAPLAGEVSTPCLGLMIQEILPKETDLGIRVITRLPSHQNASSQALSVSTASLDQSLQVTTSATSSRAENEQLWDRKFFSDVRDNSNDRNQITLSNQGSYSQRAQPSEPCPPPEEASSTSSVKCQSPQRTFIARYCPPQSINDEELDGRTQVLNEDISTPTASTQLSLLDRWSAWAFASLTSTFHFATIYLPRNVYWFYLATFESRDHLLRAMAGRSLNVAVTWSHIQATLHNPIYVAGIFLGLTTLSPYIQQLPYGALHLLASSHLQPVPLWVNCRPVLSYVGHLILSVPTTVSARRLLAIHSPFR